MFDFILGTLGGLIGGGAIVFFVISVWRDGIKDIKNLIFGFVVCFGVFGGSVFLNELTNPINSRVLKVGMVLGLVISGIGITRKLTKDGDL